MSENNDTVTETKTAHCGGREVTISVEVEKRDESDEERAYEIAIAALEGGLNTEYESWDENHPVPTVNNRVI